MYVLLIGLFGCSGTPVIKGKVLDIWENPVEGALIQMEGSVEGQTSNSSGEFSFAIENSSDTNLRFRAGADKYIHDVEVVVFSASEDNDQLPVVTFHLYPEPSSKGFHAIGNREYETLDGHSTKRVATKLEAYHGLNSIGKVTFAENEKQHFLFYSSLRKEEIKQIDLSLHRLEFKEEEEVKGVLGETPIEIDLWLAKGNVLPFGLRTLDQEDMYLIELTKPLDKGVYAFHSGNYLTSADPRKEDTIPEELKVAYPFEIK